MPQDVLMLWKYQFRDNFCSELSCIFCPFCNTFTSSERTLKKVATLALRNPVVVAAPELKLLQWGETLDFRVARIRDWSVKGKAKCLSGRERTKVVSLFIARKGPGKVTKEGTGLPRDSRSAKQGIQEVVISNLVQMKRGLELRWIELRILCQNFSFVAFEPNS